MPGKGGVVTMWLPAVGTGAVIVLLHVLLASEVLRGNLSTPRLAPEALALVGIAWAVGIMVGIASAVRARESAVKRTLVIALAATIGSIYFPFWARAAAPTQGGPSPSEVLGALFPPLGMTTLAAVEVASLIGLGLAWWRHNRKAARSTPKLRRRSARQRSAGIE